MKIQNINNNNNTDVNKQTTNDLPPVGALLPSENRWRREIQPFPSSPREKARRRRTFFMEGFPSDIFWVVVYNYCLFWSYLLCVPSHASPFFFSLYLSRCYWFLFLDVRRNDKQCLGSYPRVFSMLLIHFCTSRSISLVSCV